MRTDLQKNPAMRNCGQLTVPAWRTDRWSVWCTACSKTRGKQDRRGSHAMRETRQLVSGWTRSSLHRRVYKYSISCSQICKITWTQR